MSGKNLDESSPDPASDILTALEAQGVRVSLSDENKIELRGAEAPTELRRALMAHGAAVRAILAQRRALHEGALDTAHLG